MQVIKAVDERQNNRRENSNLDDRYGKIGISAVAAAVRYRGDTRNLQRDRRIPLDRD